MGWKRYLQEVQAYGTNVFVNSAKGDRKFYANGAAPSGVLEHPGTLKNPSKVKLPVILVR